MSRSYFNHRLLVTTSRQLLRRGESGREFVRPGYEPGVVAGKMSEVYEKAISGMGTRAPAPLRAYPENHDDYGAWRPGVPYYSEA